MIYLKNVRVEIEDKDRYERKVGKIYQDKIYINLEMVKKGLAWWYRQYAKQATDIQEAEKQARVNKIGIWSHENAMPPWEFRRIKQQPTATKQNAEIRYWVTLSSGRVHNSSCRWYQNSDGYFEKTPTGPNCKICGGSKTPASAIKKENDMSSFIPYAEPISDGNFVHQQDFIPEAEPIPGETIVYDDNYEQRMISSKKRNKLEREETDVILKKYMPNAINPCESQFSPDKINRQLFSAKNYCDNLENNEYLRDKDHNYTINFPTSKNDNHNSSTGLRTSYTGNIKKDKLHSELYSSAYKDSYPKKEYYERKNYNRFSACKSKTPNFVRDKIGFMFQGSFWSGAKEIVSIIALFFIYLCLLVNLFSKRDKIKCYMGEENCSQFLREIIARHKDYVTRFVKKIENKRFIKNKLIIISFIISSIIIISIFKGEKTPSMFLKIHFGVGMLFLIIVSSSVRMKDIYFYNFEKENKLFICFNIDDFINNPAYYKNIFDFNKYCFKNIDFNKNMVIKIEELIIYICLFRDERYYSSNIYGEKNVTTKHQRAEQVLKKLHSLYKE
nr:MAG TPA: nuclease-like protein [Caudoviricetes sp.]